MSSRHVLYVLLKINLLHAIQCSIWETVEVNIFIMIYHFLQAMKATLNTFEPELDKTNKWTSAPSEDRSAWDSAQSNQSLGLALCG